MRWNHMPLQAKRNGDPTNSERRQEVRIATQVQNFSIGVNASFKQPSKGSSTTSSEEDKKPAARNTQKDRYQMRSVEEEDTKPRAIEPQARILEEVSLQDNRQQLSELQGSAGEAMNIPPIEPVAQCQAHKKVRMRKKTQSSILLSLWMMTLNPFEGIPHWTDMYTRIFQVPVEEIPPNIRPKPRNL